MQAENFGMVLRDGPRLRYDYNVWMEAKDTGRDRVLLGGLGGMGVGTMWFPMSERHEKLPGFDDAPEMDASPDYSYVDCRDVVGVDTGSGRRGNASETTGKQVWPMR